MSLEARGPGGRSPTDVGKVFLILEAGGDATGKPHTTIALELGVSPASVGKYLREAREVVLTADSIQQDGRRQRVLRAIAESDRGFDSPGDLIHAVSRPGERGWDQNGLVVLLWRLQKDGLISFRHAPASGHLSRIKALPSLHTLLGLPTGRVGEPPAGPRSGDTFDPRAHGTKANGGPIERVTRQPTEDEQAQAALLAHGHVPAGWDAGMGDTVSLPADTPPEAPPTTLGGPSAAETPEVAPESTPEPTVAPEPSSEPLVEHLPSAVPAWPVLAELRARLEDVQRARRAARLIEEAAELLSGDERAGLLDKATALVVDHDMTPAEEEYLKFADWIVKGRQP